MISWCLFLTICSFTSLSYGGMHNDLSKVMKPDDGVIMSFEDEGRVIDCIDIYKQSAFQHPLLVNHTIQLEPDEQPSEPNDYAIFEGPHPLMNLTQSCPQGSIPIERTQSNIDHFGGKTYLLKRPPPFLRQTDLRRNLKSMRMHVTLTDTGHYNGGKATINLWNPQVEKTDSFSLSQVWIISGDSRTTLEAGWIVYERLNGDRQTRLFTFWTVDGYQHGCYNLHCPGFVQTNSRFTLNAALRPTSVYGGVQYDITIAIFRDWKTGHWWLFVEDMAMGYWPKALVGGLANGAKYASFGGEVTTSNPSTVASSQMGSGHFASEGYGKSSFFKNLMVVNTSNWYVFPGNFRPIVTDGACYDLRVGSNKGTSWGYYFHYGGPGRSSKCF